MPTYINPKDLPPIPHSSPHTSEEDAEFSRYDDYARATDYTPVPGVKALAPFQNAIQEHMSAQPLPLLDERSTKADLRKADMVMTNVAALTLHAGWAGVSTMADCYKLTETIMDFLKKRHDILKHTETVEEEVPWEPL